MKEEKGGGEEERNRSREERRGGRKEGENGRREGKEGQGRGGWKGHRCFIPSVVVTTLYGSTRQPACVTYHVQLPLTPHPQFYLSSFLLSKPSPPTRSPPQPAYRPTRPMAFTFPMLSANLLHSLTIYHTHLSVYHHTVNPSPFVSTQILFFF